MCDYLVFMTYVGRFSPKSIPPRWNVSCLLVYYRWSEHCAMHSAALAVFLAGVAPVPLAHLCTNSGPLGNIYKSHQYAGLFSPPNETLTTLGLLVCGVVEPNPGPVNNTDTIFLCGYCGLNVGWSMEGVCCSVSFHCCLRRHWQVGLQPAKPVIPELGLL